VSCPHSNFAVFPCWRCETGLGKFNLYSCMPMSQVSVAGLYWSTCDDRCDRPATVCRRLKTATRDLAIYGQLVLKGLKSPEPSNAFRKLFRLI